MNKLIHKQLVKVPFYLFVVFIILPFLFFLINTKLFLFFYYVLLVYVVYKTIIFFIFSIVGLYKHQKEANKSYLNYFRSNGIEVLPIQFIAIATYKESSGVLLKTIKSIENQNYPKDKIRVNISFEERRIKQDPTYQLVIDEVEEYISNSKIQIQTTIHPDNIEYEVAGAASNKNWAVQSYLEKLSASETESTIVTIPDADTILHPNYLSNLGNKFYESKNPEKIFVQPAVYRFVNNYPKIRSFTRIIAATITLSILSSSAYKSRHRYTFSCFSLKLKTLIDSEFWDTSIPIDDTPFYWRPYSLFKGDWKCEVIYSPISVNAVYSEKLLENVQEQYIQFYRWGWGVLAFPIGVQTIISTKKISIYKKVRDIFTLVDNTVLTKTIFISLTICTLIDTYTTDNIIQEIFNLNYLVFIVPLTILLRISITPYENLSKFFYKLVQDMIFVFPIGIINLVLFGYLPYLHASYDFARKHKNYEKISWTEKK